jgi:hypothetical protein
MVQWADGQLQLPQSVRYPIFIAEEAPWLLEPMRALSDKKVRRVDIRGPAGSAKTLVGEIHIAYVVANDPGPYYYVWQSDEDGADMMEDRVFPMLEGNRILLEKMPTDRHKKRIRKIAFHGMSFYSVGANKNSAQSKRIRYLTMEEPHLYQPGMMSAFEKRCEGVKKAKILTLSTGSVLDDESDKTFNKGTCERWEVPCPHCGEYQIMTDSKDRLIADRNESTFDSEGNIIWHKFLPTVRYNCEHCGRDWPKDDFFRREQAKKGRYRAQNPNAPEDHRSFHYEAVSVHWTKLEDIISEKLIASYAAKRGSLELLKDYMQKRRAMPWDESPETDSSFDIKRLTGVYIKREAVESEICRQMTIDNQAGRSSRGEGAHRWFVCRSYSETESRLIDEGRIETWEELEERRIELGVEPMRTLVDVAYDTQNVQAVCIKYGWQGLWGDTGQRESFPHTEIVGGKSVIRNMPFSPPKLGHVTMVNSREMRQARYFFWCNLPIQNLYHRMRMGLTGYKFTIAQDTSEDYKAQTSVEYKRQVVDASGHKKWIWTRPPGKQDHLLDCDLMNVASALLDPRMRAILMGFIDESQKEDQTPAENG